MGVISQHQLSTFTTPVNATSPIDANTVRGNDNSIKTSYNAHDADTTIHLQSGAVASRPAASTANQTWLATDTGAVYAYLDTGSAWVEVNYLRNTGGTITGTLTVTGATTLQSTLAVTGAATFSSTINGQTITSAANFTGSVTVASGLTVSAGTSAVQALTATTATLSSHLTLGTNATFIKGVTSAAATVNIFSLTQDAGGNITRFLAGVDAAGFQWTNQAASVQWMGLVGGVLSVASGVTVTAGGLTVTGGATIATGNLQVSSGTISASNTLTITSGGITVTGNSTITGTLGGITTLTATTLAGTLSTAAQANVTSLGTLTGLTVAGNAAITGTGTITGSAGAGLVTVTSTTGAAADTVTLTLARGGTAGYSIGVNLNGLNTDDFNIYKSATKIVTYDGTWTFSRPVTTNSLLLTAVSATGGAGFRLPHGAAPTSPVDGDMWSTTAGFFIRINGVTKSVNLT